MSEAAAIARLLADPDPGIASALRRQLIGRPEDPPGLRDAVEELPDPIDRARAREARLEIGRERSAERIIRAQSDMDLETCAFEIARMEDPDIDVACAARALDALADRVRDRIHAASGGRAKLEELCRFLGDEEGFEGDRSEEEFARGSSLPHVLERKRGLPIALSAVYMLVARRVGLELYGVGAPVQFLVGAPLGDETLYVDAFDRGRILDADGAAILLRGLGVSFRPEHLAPTPVKPMIARMARNLVQLYARRPRGEQRARRYARVAMSLEDAL